MMRRRFLPLAFVCAAPFGAIAGAQSIYDIGARTAPQFHSYTVNSPSDTKISEFAVPLFVMVPITANFGFDVGSSYVSSKVDQTVSGKKTSSSISGLTDTQIRATLGNDFVVLTAGVNLPTGTSTVPQSKQRAASLIGSDFLSFPISNMGTGFGGTGGIAFAQPLGDWNLGAGVSMRHSAQYDPFDVGGGPALHYQPGNEIRVRVGVDHALGTGRVTIGETYSTFGDDNLGNSIYNTGNRYLTQLSVNNTIAGGQVTLTGWNLFRTSGTLADGTLLDHENIANGALAYGVNVGGMTIEPNVEGRFWVQPKSSNSMLATVGLRAQFEVLGFTVLPGGGFSFGVLAAQDAAGLNTTASLTGFHGVLAIRLR
jgi:hypothetical protein